MNNKNKALLQIIYKKACQIYPLLEGSSENIGVVNIVTLRAGILL